MSGLPSHVQAAISRGAGRPVPSGPALQAKAAPGPAKAAHVVAAVAACRPPAAALPVQAKKAVAAAPPPRPALPTARAVAPPPSPALRPPPARPVPAPVGRAVQMADPGNQKALEKFLEEQGVDLDDDDQPKKRGKKKDEDATYRGARLVGNSSALARARFNRGPKGKVFKAWKHKREAQHLVPASLHRKHPALKGIVDSAENGMMLPSTWNATNTKLTHRRPGYRDHPVYTRHVGAMIKKIETADGKKVNQKTLRLVMDALRPVNKLTLKYKYVDDIPLKEMTGSWNLQNPGRLI